MPLVPDQGLGSRLLGPRVLCRRDSEPRFDCLGTLVERSGEVGVGHQSYTWDEAGDQFDIHAAWASRQSRPPVDSFVEYGRDVLCAVQRARCGKAQ